MRKHFYVGAALVVTLFTLGAGCSSSKTTSTTSSASNTNQVNAANTNVVPFNTTASDSAVASDVNGQWASGATASTQYGNEDWSAKKATEKPDVEKYGDNSKAWAPAEKNKGTETLELTYSKAVYASGVRIRESLGSGAVTGVELKDIDGKYHSVWSGDDTTKELNYLQIPIATTPYKVSGVKITFNTTLSPEDWVEVDAVQLVGK